MEAKAKASQNKDEAEQRRIIQTLLAADDTAAQDMGHFMQQALASHLHE